VQADRFLDKRKSDPKLAINENWDDSVKALVNYPDVVKKMSTDLDWTTDLGEAVVADQKGVMDAIQVFRRKAQSVGNLKSDDKQKVEVEKEIITIVPANPEVIYVPQYNPITVNRNTNINTGNINRGNINSGNRPSQGAGSGGSAWKSNKQPGQVSSGA